MYSEADVAIIGAGPAGSVAAASLARKGWRVAVFEQSRFPRFSIGESLLPQSMQFLDEAGLLARVEAAGFQLKDGAAFQQGDMSQSLEFGEKSATGWSSTFEGTRADFDQGLAAGAGAAGGGGSLRDTCDQFRACGERQFETCDSRRDRRGSYDLGTAGA